MNARASIHEMFPLDEAATAELDARLDGYRTEALAKAVGRLRAIPVDCTALTGPVWYGDGWNSAITCLEEIADYQTPDDEAYPGELQRLRALTLGLRVAVLRKEDLTEARRLLVIHAEHEMDAREKGAAAALAAPDVRAIVHAALSTVQGGLHHLGLVTLEVLTDRVTEAVAPLVGAVPVVDGVTPPAPEAGDR